MPSNFEEFSESSVVDVEGVRTLEKNDVDFSIPWLLFFLVAIIAAGVGWGISKSKKDEEEEEDTDSKNNS